MVERLDLLPAGADDAAGRYLETLKEGASRASIRAALARVACLVARVPCKNGNPIGRGGLAGVDLSRVPWAALSAELCAYVRAQLAAKYSPATVRLCTCALRGVLRVVGALDGMKMAATCAAKPKRRPRPYTPTGHARDDALRALRSLGLTLPSIVALDASAWRRGGTRLIVRGRSMRVPDELGDVLDRWVSVRGTEPGPLFCRTGKGGRVWSAEPISAEAARKAVRFRTALAA